MEKLTPYVKQLDDPLRVPVYFCLFNIFWTWIAAEITGNASQVDRVWTFLPTVYTTYFALYPFITTNTDIQVNQRVILMAVLQTIWMFRLSYNTWRRGLFRLSDEDYRWPILRSMMSKPLWKVFNLVFIAFAQNWILFGLGIPAYHALVETPAALGPTDAILTTLVLLDLLIEFTADNQQYSFQTFKHSKDRKPAPDADWPGARIKWTEEDAKRGFVTRGLWAWSRHPNFAAEQTFWWLMCVFPLINRGIPWPGLDTLVNSSTFASKEDFIRVYSYFIPLAPASILTCLFLSSAAFSENISKQKYPEGYSAYQRRVGMFSPIATVLKAITLTLQGQKVAIDRLLWVESSPKAKTE